MRTTERYTFRLLAKQPDGTLMEEADVHPLYEGLELKWDRESGAAYHKKSVSGTLKFIGKDFALVHRQSVRTHFTVVVYDWGEEAERLYFRKTDCETDVDHAIAEATVSVRDPYKTLSAGLDTEYDVVKLGLEKHMLEMSMYPVNQTYFHNSDSILISTLHTQHVATVDNPKDSVGDLQTFNFSVGHIFPGYETRWKNIGILGAIIIEDSKYGSEIGYEPGKYYNAPEAGSCNMPDEWDTGTSVAQNACSYNKITLYKDGIKGNARIEITVQVPESSKYAIYFSGLYFKKGGSYPLAAVANSTNYNGRLYGNVPLATGVSRYVGRTKVYLLKIIQSGDNKGRVTDEFDLECKSRFWVCYNRRASYKSVSGSDEHRIFGDDVYRGNYRSVYHEYVQPVIAYVSANTSDDDTGYGRTQDGKYYDKPTGIGTCVPMEKESWAEGMSVWLGENYILELTTRSSVNIVTDEYIYDYYTLGDVIKAVLGEIDSNIVFDSDTAHSQFLFAEKNPVSGEEQGTLYITQKSNVLNLGYDYPAWMAPVTMEKIFTLLENVFNCQWDLYYGEDGKWHLRIEHKTFYMNGHGYTQQDREVLDLGKVADSMNRLPMSYRTERWKYDTTTQADTYEYGWMDTQSAMFDGDTIQTEDGYGLFTEHKKEDKKTDWFSSDIDFLTAVPEECESDGFCIVMEDLKEHDSVLEERKRKNTHLALEYLQPRFCWQGMYGEKIRIGDSTVIDNDYRAKLRTAEVSFRVPKGVVVSPDMLIRTDAGDGEIDSLTLDMTSGQYTASLRYETEQ